MDFEKFIKDNTKAGSISVELKDKILNLYDEYKLPFLTKNTNILWTDFEKIEPYNRHGCFYCDGASFDNLGEPIFQNDFYREFISTSYFNHNISFSIYEFNYNTYYKSIRFGLCIEENKTEEFIAKLRKLINK